MLQRKDSNLRPLAYETSKLPTAPRCDVQSIFFTDKGLLFMTILFQPKI